MYTTKGIRLTQKVKREDSDSSYLRTVYYVRRNKTIIETTPAPHLATQMTASVAEQLAEKLAKTHQVEVVDLFADDSLPVDSLELLGENWTPLSEFQEAVKTATDAGITTQQMLDHINQYTLVERGNVHGTN
jgi:hypothetical protein